MAINVIDIKYNKAVRNTIHEFICDTDTDFILLPKCDPGSTAVSVATGTIYVVNASGNWVEFGVGAGDPEPVVVTPAGLYETGAIALYKEQGAEAIEGMVIKSWDELVSSGEIIVENGNVLIGTVLPDNLPELNEYGFYYGVPYYDSYGNGMRFYEDGSISEQENGEPTHPAGFCEYDTESIYMSKWNFRLSVSSNGTVLVDTDGYKYGVGSKPEFKGELIIPNDGTVNTIGDYTFSYDANLTGVLITDSVTHIGEGAFQYASKLARVVIPGSVKSIGSCAFANCEALSNVTIEEGVEIIEQCAFQQCFKGYIVGYDPGSAIVYVPSTITEMHSRCFAEGGLTDMYYNGTCDQFYAIKKASGSDHIFYYNSKSVVHCTDGDYDWSRE